MSGKAKTAQACRTFRKSLLNAEQASPSDSLFRDVGFEKTGARLHNENAAMVIADIFPLIVSRAEILCAYREEHLGSLTGHLNQRWYGCIPTLNGPVPQPDYAVGFKDSAFTEDQLQKLEPFTKKWKRAPLLATADADFPFLPCEAKCGNRRPTAVALL